MRYVWCDVTDVGAVFNMFQFRGSWRLVGLRTKLSLGMAKRARLAVAILVRVIMYVINSTCINVNIISIAAAPDESKNGHIFFRFRETVQP